MKRRQKLLYVLLLAACYAVAIVAGWSSLGARFDNDVYDFLFSIQPQDTKPPEAIVAGIDGGTLRQSGGVPALRRILADGLDRISAAKPRAIVVDVLLADATGDDDRLASVFARTPNLVLATDLSTDNQGWELPLADFRQSAAAVGHAHSDPDSLDYVVRGVPLEKANAGQRYFALALEAFRIAHPGWSLVESPDSLHLGPMIIPVSRRDARFLRIRYRSAPEIPEITFSDLRDNPDAAARFAGKVVFVGVTAQGGSDRYMTPLSESGQTTPGVEINANIYETLAGGVFLVPAGNFSIVLACAALAIAAGLLFYRFSGWITYSLAGVLLLGAHLAPYVAFRGNLVFPYAAPLFTAWLSVSAAASFQHFVVRRMLRKAEAEREGYQQAIHFVAHEMRTPLTAIQGSSELMGRYKLSEEKRAEMATMINSESKRLARLIQTFLDVERLTAGQMDLKREPFETGELVRICLQRAQPLADRKKIQITLDTIPETTLLGDRELMEYAFYNLVTNAIKYSNSSTEVTVSAHLDAGHLRLAVQDQGIGMDEKELGNIFRKFYRTKKAESSGETGTGIGLSIVEQIVTQHGGKMEVSSKPGVGSCFTMVLPASASVVRKSP